MPASYQSLAKIPEIQADFCSDSVPQVVRMRISGHRTDSMERRYNIVDIEDIQSAKELMQRRRKNIAASGDEKD
jgi:hypothetical protein